MTGYTKTAIHEAGHFIAILMNNKAINKFPHIIKLDIIGNTDNAGFIRIKPDYEILSILNGSGLDEIYFKDPYKNFFLNRIQEEIKYNLSGYASELIYFKKRSFCNLSKYIILKHILEIESNDENADLNRAIRLWSFLNFKVYQKDNPDLIDNLINPLNKAVKDLLTNWNCVLKVANLLDEHKVIDGNDLNNLVDEFYELVEVKIFMP